MLAARLSFGKREISKEIHEMVYISDMILQGGCSLRRPVHAFKRTRFLINGQRVSRAVYDHLDLLAMPFKSRHAHVRVAVYITSTDIPFGMKPMRTNQYLIADCHRLLYCSLACN
jgi:hypothetical protein